MQHFVIGTAGHIDHGKTTLVRRLTGIDTDRLPEEKRRGISIDLGFALWQTAGLGCGVIDVPGHERLIRNMVAGASGIDLALVVIAADDGVMPQTREHIEILDLLGIDAGVVAVTKIDTCEPDLLPLVIQEIEETCAGTFLAGCPIVPVSAQTGQGIADLEETLRTTLRGLSRARRGELFRMPIDRSFSIPGFGTIATGTITSGDVRTGDVLELWPQGLPVRVRGLQQHGAATDQGLAGQRAAINLAGIKAEELERGNELATVGSLRLSQRLLVSLRALPSAPVPLKDRMSLMLHLGTRELAARLVLKGVTLAPGESAYAELRLAAPIVAEHGQHFVLRRQSPPCTVAGGVIVDPGLEPGRRVRDLQSRGAAWHASDPAARLAALLSETDTVPATGESTAWRTGIPPREYSLRLAELIERGEVVRPPAARPDRLVHRGRLESLTEAVLQRIRGELARHQPRRSLPRPLLAAACRTLASPELVDTALDVLRERGALVQSGENLGPADVQVRLTKKQTRARQQMLDAITGGGLAPPTLPDLCKLTGLGPEQALELLRLAVEEGELTRIDPDLFLTPAALIEGRSICIALLARLSTATMSQLREAWGVSRKYSLPLCQHFDAEQVTVREGDLRRAGPAALNA